MTVPLQPVHPTLFADRHIGAHGDDAGAMLQHLGYASARELAAAALPSGIRQQQPLRLPAPRTEAETLAELRALADRNVPAVQMIGQGYYTALTPPVIQRNVLESPAWYTAYTPYQPEISQGRLEALLNFQTMVEDLTALPIANASLLDEATAVAEAVMLMRRVRAAGPGRDRIILDADCLPQTIAVVRGRAQALDFDVEVAYLSAGLPDGELTGVVLQQPGTSGEVRHHAALITEAHERGALVTVAADLLALTLIAPPGEQGADIAVGSAQRFGVPLFFGGPHAAYMAVRKGLERSLPGRLVGVSRDSSGSPAYRLALQTREQHIRREKATSNICTAQALLAIVASMYALVGLAKPGEFGGDVSHLNLHKTFCIPHGGGGPGVGPVAVAEHLVPFLPADPAPVHGHVIPEGHPAAQGHGVPVAASRYGSAGVLPISWAYINLMGADGLTAATESALLTANYIAARLQEHFPVLYTGRSALVAHECILDLRPLTARTGVTAEDVAKRLIDYGFHAPTLSFPVAGTLMVEPTESEDLAEIERFIQAMIAIRGEIEEVANGRFPVEESPLRRSPHTAVVMAGDVWDRPYSREQGAFPVPSLRVDKYFPPVGRIDNAAGDRNLVCSCPPIEEFVQHG